MLQKIEEHRLPTFSGITLCISGIEDLDRRTTINRTVTQHCGKYAKNIERPVRVTHLLCSGNDETDKMRYARKFNERGEADIKLVWEEWFWDSLNFGGTHLLSFSTLGTCDMTFSRTVRGDALPRYAPTP